MPRTSKAGKKDSKPTVKPATANPHRSFRVSRRAERPARTKPVSGWQLLKGSLVELWHAKWVFTKATILYMLLILVLAWDRLSEGSSVWLLVLLVIMSLAEIWIVRQVLSGERPKLKAALYRGMAQIIPFSLLVLLALIQLIPMAVGLYLFQIVVINGIAVHAWEQALFVSIWALLSLLSFYWLMTSLLALYIVTLPELTPMRAWHTARNIIEGRRVVVGMRLLPVFIFVLVAGYALLLVAPEDWVFSYNVFWVIVALLLPVTHMYCYKLYRALV